jgi:hypothetical protein
MENNYAEKLLTELLEKLEQFPSPEEGDINTAHTCAQESAFTLRKLETYMRETSLSSEEEISLLKHTKPKITGRLIFYLKLLFIQQTLPALPEEKLSFLKSLQEEIKNFTNDHMALHMYYLMGWDHLDQQYFIRHPERVISTDPAYFVFADNTVNTLESYRFSQFHANELLSSFILKTGQALLGNPVISFLKWTGTQAEATEWLYAFNELGVFGGRRQPMRVIKLAFEQAFDFNLGNIYKNHENNRLRKKSRTAFLHRAVLALERKYDHDDEYAL